MRKKLFLAALMCVLIPLASYAIPISSLDNTVKGSSPAPSSALASIILSKGLSIAPPSANPPVLTVNKPAELNSTKTAGTFRQKNKQPAVQFTPPIEGPSGEELPEIIGGGNGYPPPDSQAAPVPEPATMLLLGTGLVGAATLRKFF